MSRPQDRSYLKNKLLSKKGKHFWKMEGTDKM